MMQSHNKTVYEALGRHPVHPFPARMAPGIAFDIVSQQKKTIRVLDPMAGSGTVLALARASGHKAIGTDIDPLAVLISKVWTTAIDRLKARRTANAVLSRARDTFNTLRLGESYPIGADAQTRKFIRYWFDDYARRQLAALAIAIRKTRDENIRNVLWCAFSRLIITKQSGASLARDLAHSRPHKTFDAAPVKPFNNFLVAVDRVLENCILHTSPKRGPAPSIAIGDARKLKLSDCSVDLVLTSPPYLNAIDYMRCSKFSLVWMGYQTEDIRNLRSRGIGTEVGQYEAKDYAKQIIAKLKLGKRLSSRHKAVLSRFVEDMRVSLGEISRVLAPGGRAVCVVGENSIRGTYVRNSKIVTVVAQKAGLVLQKRRSRALPSNRRYLPPPSDRKRKAALDTRMRREVVLSFRKPKLKSAAASASSRRRSAPG